MASRRVDEAVDIDLGGYVVPIRVLKETGSSAEKRIVCAESESSVGDASQHSLANFDYIPANWEEYGEDGSFSGDEVGKSSEHVSSSAHVLVGKKQVTGGGITSGLGSQILSNHEFKMDYHSFVGFNRWGVLSTLEEDQSERNLMETGGARFLSPTSAYVMLPALGNALSTNFPFFLACVPNGLGIGVICNINF